MTATGYIRGRPAYWDGSLYRWQDTDAPAGPAWGGEERPCPVCGEMATPEGYDPCIGFVPGATSVCCGHGVESQVRVASPDPTLTYTDPAGGPDWEPRSDEA